MFPPNCRIFIGNLHPEHASPELVASVFERFGRLGEAPVVRKSYGFVQFLEEKAAREAIEKANGLNIGGHRIELSLADNRPPKNRDSMDSKFRKRDRESAPLRSSRREASVERYDGRYRDERDAGFSFRRSNEGGRLNSDGRSTVDDSEYMRNRSRSPRRDRELQTKKPMHIAAPDPLSDVLIIRVDRPNRGYCLNVEEQLTTSRLLFEDREVDLPDLPEMLLAISEKFSVRHVFIIGSRHERLENVTYGTRRPSGRIEEFREMLVKEAIRQLTSAAGTAAPAPLRPTSGGLESGVIPMSRLEMSEGIPSKGLGLAGAGAGEQYSGKGPPPPTQLSQSQVQHQLQSQLQPINIVRPTSPRQVSQSGLMHAANMRDSTPASKEPQLFSQGLQTNNYGLANPTTWDGRGSGGENLLRQDPASSSAVSNSGSGGIDSSLDNFLQQLRSGGGIAALSQSSTREALLRVLQARPDLVNFLISKVQPELAARAPECLPSGPQQHPPPQQVPQLAVAAPSMSQGTVQVGSALNTQNIHSNQVLPFQHQQQPPFQQLQGAPHNQHSLLPLVPNLNPASGAPNSSSFQISVAAPSAVPPQGQFPPPQNRPGFIQGQPSLVSGSPNHLGFAANSASPGGGAHSGSQVQPGAQLGQFPQSSHDIPPRFDPQQHPTFQSPNNNRPESIMASAHDSFSAVAAAAASALDGLDMGSLQDLLAATAPLLGASGNSSSQANAGQSNLSSILSSFVAQQQMPVPSAAPAHSGFVSGPGHTSSADIMNRSAQGPLLSMASTGRSAASAKLKDEPSSVDLLNLLARPPPAAGPGTPPLLSTDRNSAQQPPFQVSGDVRFDRGPSGTVDPRSAPVTAGPPGAVHFMGVAPAPAFPPGAQRFGR